MVISHRSKSLILFALLTSALPQRIKSIENLGDTLIASGVVGVCAGVATICGGLWQKYRERIQKEDEQYIDNAPTLLRDIAKEYKQDLSAPLELLSTTIQRKSGFKVYRKTIKQNLNEVGRINKIIKKYTARWAKYEQAQGLYPQVVEVQEELAGLRKRVKAHLRYIKLDQQYNELIKKHSTEINIYTQWQQYPKEQITEELKKYIRASSSYCFEPLLAYVNNLNEAINALQPQSIYADAGYADEGSSYNDLAEAVFAVRRDFEQIRSVIVNDDDYLDEQKAHQERLNRERELRIQQQLADAARQHAEEIARANNIRERELREKYQRFERLYHLALTQPLYPGRNAILSAWQEYRLHPNDLNSIFIRFNITL